MPASTKEWGAKLAALLTHDFKEADKYVDWIWTPLGSLLLAATATLLGGFFLHPQCFVMFAGILGMLVLGAAWPWLALAGLSGRLSFSKARCREGDEVELTIAVRNWLPWGTWGLMVLGLEREGILTAAAARGQGLPHAPGRRETRRSWTFTPPCRGAYPVGRPLLACGFPFGLWLAKKPLTLEGELLVWPRTLPVGSLPEEAGEQNQDRGVYCDQPGTMGDILGVRPYRRGDPLRRIHWPQSARHDRLIVCERQSVALPTVRLVLDLDPTAHRGAGPDGSLEWSIRVVASLVEGWREAGARLELAFGTKFFGSDAGLSQQHRLFDALARIVPEGGTPLSEVLKRPEVRERGAGACVIVTTDLGLVLLSARLLKDPSVHWVVLRADCFGGSCHDHAAHRPLPLRPWLLLSNPEHLPHQLRPQGPGVCRVR